MSPPIHRVEHVLCLLKSFHHWTGRHLIEIEENITSEGLAKALFEAPFVVISHGIERDPILNYGNRAALRLWEMSWEQFTRTPSRLTAEPVNQEERATLLARVTKKGFIDDYQGIRISATGKRFRIERAIVWNLIDKDQRYCGQAATFDRWVYLKSENGS
jgi:MEKHLA domain-containing protein